MTSHFELDKFMIETMQNVSTVEIIEVVLTNSPLLVTTTFVSVATLTQTMIAGPKGSSSPLPPWLASQTPKRKKQVVSPNDVDFGQLVPVKITSIEKLKTLSRVLVGTAGYKYVEVAQSPMCKVAKDIDISQYSIIRAELSKRTHEYIKDDA